MKPDLHRFPLLVAWEMTRACLLACLHCRASAEPDPLPGELSTEEGLKLLRELATYTPKPILLPTGGDPLARPDLFPGLTRPPPAPVTEGSNPGSAYLR
jgi:MoaA/NifB/PqqE/SkfB family radical SAM enzyme